jgi:hypothetical protein
VGEGGVQAIRSMLVLCLVRLGAHLLPVAVGIGAVLGAITTLITALRTGVLVITISNGVIAIGGAVTALAGIATG